ARSKIQKLISVHVFHDGAVAFFCYQRIFARQRRRHELGVGGDDLLRLRPREGGHEARCFCFQSRWHFFLQSRSSRVGVNQNCEEKRQARKAADSVSTIPKPACEKNLS